MSLIGSGGVYLAGFHEFMRGDALINPVRVAGGLIKGLYTFPENLAFSLMTETLIGSSLVSGGTRNKSHVLLHIITNMCEFLRDHTM